MLTFFILNTQIQFDEDELPEVPDVIMKPKKAHSKSCPWPNTVPQLTGICKCIPGYISSYPLDERGCWKCDPECNMHASCEYKDVSIGKCSCKFGLIGDGVNNCSVPHPSIDSIYSLHSETYSKIMIQYSFQHETDFSPFFGLCKFSQTKDMNNFTIVNSVLYYNSSISCIVPYFTETDAFVSITFDSEFWSQPQSVHIFPYPQITVNNSSQNSPEVPVSISKPFNYWYIVSIIIAIGGTILSIFFPNPPNKVHSL